MNLHHQRRVIYHVLMLFRVISQGSRMKYTPRWRSFCSDKHLISNCFTAFLSPKYISEITLCVLSNIYGKTTTVIISDVICYLTVPLCIRM